MDHVMCDALPSAEQPRSSPLSSSYCRRRGKTWLHWLMFVANVKTWLSLYDLGAVDRQVLRQPWLPAVTLIAVPWSLFKSTNPLAVRVQADPTLTMPKAETIDRSSGILQRLPRQRAAERNCCQENALHLWLQGVWMTPLQVAPNETRSLSPLTPRQQP